MTIKIADQFELWPTARLKRYERNSRIHTPEQVRGIAASIREFGFLAPIVVDTRRDRIAAGHGRLEAAELLGMAEVPVIAVGHLTESQFRAYVIADNRHTDNSSFDMALLAEELADLAHEFDADVLGFTDDELAALLPDDDDDEAPPAPRETDPDAVPQAPAEPTSRRGDVWRLGSHRKIGAAHRWYGDRDKTTVVELGDPAVTVAADGAVQICQGETTLVIRGNDITIQRVRGSVFFKDKPARNAEHPTMKPVALVQRQLANSTNPGDVVLDLFGGSGSTLIACHQLGRVARVMELDPRFVDVIVTRWQDLTGRTARLDDSGETFAEVRARRAGAAPATVDSGPALPAHQPIMVAGRPFTVAANDDEFTARRRA